MRKLKIKKIGNKKADLPSGFTVMIIILVIGFGILLFFLVRFLWQERIDREVCHQSVIFRATASGISEMVEDYIPLKCKTAKYCITTGGFLGIGGGKCDKTYKENGEEKPEAFKGESGITKVKVKSEAKGIKDIERTFAKEIIDCWSMMGEGKVNLFTQYMAKKFGIGGVVSSCVICSRIAFDEKNLKDAKIDLTKIDVQSYMRDYKAPDKEVSYLQYLAGEGGKISITDSLKLKGKEIPKVSIIEKKVKEGEKINITEEKLPEGKQERKEYAVVFMQIIAPKNLEVLKNTGYAALGTVGGVGVVSSTAIFMLGKAAVAAWKVLLPIGVLFVGYQQINVLYQRYYVTAGYCEDVMIGKEKYNGCSVVRVVDYDVAELAKYCSIIESIP